MTIIDNGEPDIPIKYCPKKARDIRDIPWNKTDNTGVKIFVFILAVNFAVVIPMTIWILIK